MLKQCQDSYHSTFGTYEDMLDYHEEQVKASQWQRCQVNTLQVEPFFSFINSSAKIFI